MGYAAPGQVTAGIHMRQFARTFIIDDETNRVVFVNVDCAMIDQLVKFEVCIHHFHLTNFLSRSYIPINFKLIQSDLK